LVHDTALLEGARQSAMQLLERDQDFSSPENARMAERVRNKRLEMAVITVS
jgi:hypothetical protein